jgi:hypothetical protein
MLVGFSSRGTCSTRRMCCKHTRPSFPGSHAPACKKVTHIKTLRSLYEIKDVRIVLAVESNLGFEAAHNARCSYTFALGISSVIQQFLKIGYKGVLRITASSGRYITEAGLTNVEIMHEPKGVGVRTTANTKESMYIAVRQALEEQTLAVWDRCQTQVWDIPQKTPRSNHFLICRTKLAWKINFRNFIDKCITTPRSTLMTYRFSRSSDGHGLESAWVTRTT